MISTTVSSKFTKNNCISTRKCKAPNIMNSVARGTLSLAGTKKFMLYKNRFSDSILDVNLHRNHCKKTTTNCFIRWTSAIYNQSH